MKDLETILTKNYEYFNREILPYYFLLRTMKNDAIVIDVRKENLPHLLGIKKSKNIHLSRLSAENLYDQLKTKTLSSIFDLIDRERFEAGTLTIEETFILEKNENFIDIFESLIHNHTIRKFQKMPGDLFDADYLNVKKYDTAMGYIGIKGSDKNDYHYFNSIIYEKNRNHNYRGIPYNIKKVERIKIEDFNSHKIKFVKSRRMKGNKTLNVAQKKDNFDFKRHKSEINNLLPENFMIKLGQYGKRSIQLFEGKRLINPHLEKELSDFLSINEIVDYISKKYTNS